MAALIATGEVAWGIQLPVQAQSRIFVQPWEASAGPAELLRVAQAADRAGALYVGVCDHVAIPKPADETMGTTWYDTMTTLGWLAGQTTSVHLLSHVLVLPYRPALQVAKVFSTLDRLSGGRAILGAGAGHLASEFEALGVDFASRGRVVEESVLLIRAAFEEEFIEAPVDGSGQTVGIAPRPVRPGGPPIWIGGSSKAAIRRAALLADGWLPQGPPEMGMRAAIEFIRDLRETEDLPSAFDIGVTGGPIYVGTPSFEVPEHALVGNVNEVVERISRMTSRGINQLQFQFLGRDVSEVCDQLSAFGEQVAPLLSS